MKRIPLFFLPLALAFFLSSCDYLTKISDKLRNKETPSRLKGVILLKIHGDIKIIRNGQEISPRPQDELQTGDTLKSGPSSYAILSFGYGSNFKVLADTEIKIENLWGAGDSPGLQAEDQDVFRFVLGKIFVFFNRPSHGTELKIRTATSSMGIRGTQFFAEISPATKGQLRTAVLEGKVAMESLALKREYLIQAGEGLTVHPDGQMEKPRPYVWVKALPWKELTEGTQAPDPTGQMEKLKTMVMEREAEKVVKKIEQQEKEEQKEQENLEAEREFAKKKELEAKKNLTPKKPSPSLPSGEFGNPLLKAIGVDEAKKSMEDHYKQLEKSKDGQE